MCVPVSATTAFAIVPTSRNGSQELPRGRKGCRRLLNSASECAGDAGLNVDLVRMQPGHQPVVVLDAAGEGSHELRDLGPERAFGQTRQDLRILFAALQGPGIRRRDAHEV